ncbi:MAG: helix-turn-helix domain-containing protein [Planctomycetota bacterium]
MAKMFYSLEEAAARLGKTEEEVQQMASSGQITEFRDGDRLIFKVDQIDLLAGDDNAADSMGSVIPLMDTGTGSGVSLEDSEPPADDPKSQTGISVFDADELDDDDPAAQTQVEPGIGGGIGLIDTGDESAINEELNMDSFGSGSGLMDLTRESDDTSLGSFGLGELYPSGDDEATATIAADDSQLFESSPGDEGLGDDLPPAGALVAAEPYDGKGSWFSAGFMVGASLACMTGLAVTVMGMMDVTIPQMLEFAGANTALAYTGGFAGIAIILGILGFVVGK